MFEKIKEIKRLSKECDKVPAPEYDSEGARIIKLSVSDDSNFISPLSCEDRPMISSETASFLELNAKHVKVNEKIRFIIKSDVIDDSEKELYPKAIDNYYSAKIRDTKLELKRNAVISFIMLLIGIVVFASIIILNAVNAQALILSVIDVIAWVFIWEAVDLWAFKRSELRNTQLLNLKLLTAKIEFTDKN
jgi:hypothetical protein